MKSKIIILLISIVYIGFAQENSEQQKPEPAPLELPNFIIEGVEQLNVKSGIKKMPDKTYSLNKSELDSLNSLEKKEQFPLPIEELPKSVLTDTYLPGYFKAHIGRFSDALLEAGYGMNYEGFELFGTAGMNYSKGHQDDAGYTDIFAKISSDYIADKKFYIFGGSRTRTDFYLKNLSYRMYPMTDISGNGEIDNKRNASEIGLNVDVDGNWEGVQFRTGASVSTLQLNSVSEYYNERKAFDNSIEGYLKARHLWNGFLLSGNVEVDFTNTSGNPTNFAQADASAEIFNDLFTLTVQSGFQYAINSEGVNRGGLLLSGEIEYRIDRNMTFLAGLESGLQKNNFTGLYNRNPYLMLNSMLDFPYDIMKLKGKYFYQPLEKFGFSVAGTMSVTDRFPYFNDSLNNEFMVQYDKVNIAQLEAETYWDINEKNNISGYLKVNFTGFDLGSNSVPNIPVNLMGINYHSKLFDDFGTKIGLNYVGERYSDKENNITIDGYFYLNAFFNYDIMNNLRIFLNAENLTNSEVYIWNGYKERGIFAALGFMWKF
jgi:outer membrane receptor protein involved in Fe transport